MMLKDKEIIFRTNFISLRDTRLYKRVEMKQ